jgi:hypothetical protein
MLLKNPPSHRFAVEHGLDGTVWSEPIAATAAERQRRWIKIKNRRHPAYSRVLDQFG